MRRWFTRAWIGILLLSSLGCQPIPVSAQTPPEEEVDLYRQIQLLNLIDGLELTAKQMRFILEKAEEAQETRESLRVEADAAEMEAILVEIRDHLMAGEDVPDELWDVFSAARGENKRLIEAYKKEATRLAEAVEGILDLHQLFALERYVPSVFPPKRDPRVSRAWGARVVALLERLRGVPLERFECQKKQLARRVLKELERRIHRRVLILDKERELQRILELLEKARSMPDAEFELEKEGLIDELLAPYLASRPEVDVTPVIVRQLLDPVIVPLLEEKLTLLEE
jgi:hypothetical protein